MPAHDPVYDLIIKKGISMPSSDIHEKPWAFYSKEIEPYVDNKIGYFLAEVKKTNKLTGEHYLTVEELSLLAHDAIILAQGIDKGHWVPIERNITFRNGSSLNIEGLDFQRTPMQDWVLGGSVGKEVSVFLFTRLAKRIAGLGIPVHPPSGESMSDVVGIYSGITEEEIQQSGEPPPENSRFKNHPALDPNWKAKLGIPEDR